MNCQGSPIKRPLRRLFSFTRWGALFTLLSLMMLIVGALRMELAAILCGSVFTLIALYSLLANRLMQAVLQRHLEKNPDPVDFTLFAAGVFPRNPVTAELNAELPRYRFPGIRIRFEILLHWPGRKPLRLSSDLKGGRNRREFEFSPAFRGCYRSREVSFLLSDLLGFTCCPVVLDLAEQLRVYPAVQPEAARRLPSLEGGGGENRRRRQRRSEELLEVRKYFPGDDIRKVNWKVFAHTSELFLRIGEETPPPESRFLVILDTAPPEAVPQRIAADYLDNLVEICAATVLEVLARGYQVFFARCDSPRLRQLTVEKNLQLLGELAEIQWSERYALKAPQQHRLQVLLFSSPGSGNLSRIFADLQGRGTEVKLFFPDLPSYAAEHRGGRFRRAVLRPLLERSGQAPGGEELQIFRNTLDREIARWSRTGTWKVAVETI